MPVKPGISYNPDAPPLKNQLSRYIIEEIEYFGRLQKLKSNQPAPTGENLFNEFKLKMNMSVSQLAFLVKLMIDTGLVENKNIAEVIRFTANFFTTKRSERVSAGSLRSKFYEVGSSTRDTVRQHLLHLVNRIDA